MVWKELQLSVILTTLHPFRNRHEYIPLRTTSTNCSIIWWECRLHCSRPCSKHKDVLKENYCEWCPLSQLKDYIESIIVQIVDLNFQKWNECLCGQKVSLSLSYCPWSSVLRITKVLLILFLSLIFNNFKIYMRKIDRERSLTIDSAHLLDKDIVGISFYIDCVFITSPIELYTKWYNTSQNTRDGFISNHLSSSFYTKEEQTPSREVFSYYENWY